MKHENAAQPIESFDFNEKIRSTHLREYFDALLPELKISTFEYEPVVNNLRFTNYLSPSVVTLGKAEAEQQKALLKSQKRVSAFYPDTVALKAPGALEEEAYARGVHFGLLKSRMIFLENVKEYEDFSFVYDDLMLLMGSVYRRLHDRKMLAGDGLHMNLYLEAAQRFADKGTADKTSDIAKAFSKVVLTDSDIVIDAKSAAKNKAAIVTHIPHTTVHFIDMFQEKRKPFTSSTLKEVDKAIRTYGIPQRLVDSLAQTKLDNAELGIQAYFDTFFQISHDHTVLALHSKVARANKAHAYVGIVEVSEDCKKILEHMGYKKEIGPTLLSLERTIHNIPEAFRRIRFLLQSKETPALRHLGNIVEAYLEASLDSKDFKE